MRMSRGRRDTLRGDQNSSDHLRAAWHSYFEIGPSNAASAQTPVRFAIEPVSSTAHWRASEGSKPYRRIRRGPGDAGLNAAWVRQARQWNTRLRWIRFAPVIHVSRWTRLVAAIIVWKNDFHRRFLICQTRSLSRRSQLPL